MPGWPMPSPALLRRAGVATWSARRMVCRCSKLLTSAIPFPFFRFIQSVIPPLQIRATYDALYSRLDALLSTQKAHHVHKLPLLALALHRIWKAAGCLPPAG